ncbi:thioredoxin domain-containing protein 6 isoform 5-T5 [Cyanocitta cristata]
MPALPWQPWGPASCCTKPREGGSGSSGPAAAAAARRSQEVRAKVGQQLDPRLEAVCSALCLGRLLKGPCSCRRMAAKKKEGVLQINITSQELWEEMLCLKGLIVVDVFQAWCGPCKPVVNLFQKIRNEVGSNLLHFAVAEVDSIDALGKYRGQWRRISGCCKRSRCTIAPEDHPGTAGRGKEGFRTWKRACAGARQSLLQRAGKHGSPAGGTTGRTNRLTHPSGPG